MTERVPANLIVGQVGARRHDTRHIIRGDYETGRAYILHSRQCVALWDDLRDCPWSLALDRMGVWLPDGEPHYVNLRDSELLVNMAPIPLSERLEAALGVE